MNRIAIKHTLKRTAGQASVLFAPFVVPPHQPAACILMYHRVAHVGFTDPALDSWNVPPAVFERQIAALSDAADCVRLEDLPAHLAPEAPRPARPLVCLTFDDGFSSVFNEVLPVLRRYNLPATAFVVTKYVGTVQPMTFDRWARRLAPRVSPDTWRPMTWDEIEGCVASGLVSIGGHSHQHLDGRVCTTNELDEEVALSRHALDLRLGPRQANAYAYPYGSSRLGEVPLAYREAVKHAGYVRAVSTDLGLATAGSDPFLLPRIEVTAVDTPAMLRAKIRGSLLPLRVIDRLRRARRSA
jgi:peptidoglycan/xylan/chitin deacetylase (PgdA/CDA1 family)